MKPSGQGVPPAMEARLQTLFSRLDTAEDFEASVLARVRVEMASGSQGITSVPSGARRKWVESDAALDRERIERARMAEWHRYSEARSELSLGNSLREIWTRYLSRFVTLETVGAAVLLGLVLQFAWSRLPAEWTAQISQLAEYTPQLLMALGALMALTPVAAILFNRYRHRLTLAGLS
jgi:hypothetical protein